MTPDPYDQNINDEFRRITTTTPPRRSQIRTPKDALYATLGCSALIVAIALAAAAIIIAIRW